MKELIKIFEDQGFDLNDCIKLDDFLVDRLFFFLPALDKKILDQKSAREICESDGFYNCDAYNPMIHLIRNNKMTPEGFKTFMMNEYYLSGGSNDEKMQEVYEVIADYIMNNGIDIIQFFREEYVYEQMRDLLEYYDDLDKVWLLENIDLKKALEYDSFATLLFNFRDCDSIESRHEHIEFILKNFDIIAPKYFDQNTYKASPHMYIRDCDTINSRPLDVIAVYLASTHGILNEKYINEELIDSYLAQLLKEKEFDALIDILNQLDNKFPDIDYKYRNKESVISYFRKPVGALDPKDVTFEIYHAYLENCTPAERKSVMANLMDYHRVIHAQSFNYDYKKNMYFDEITKDFFMLYLDSAIEVYEKDIEAVKAPWQWCGFWQQLFIDLTYLIDKKSSTPWHEEAYAKMINCDMYTPIITSYIQNNGNLLGLQLVDKYRPELLKQIIGDDAAKLYTNIVIEQFNKKVFRSGF